MTPGVPHGAQPPHMMSHWYKASMKKEGQNL